MLIVDGSNLLFQMFFGMPSRIVNADGKAIHGTLGFVGALLKIIRMVEPTHVAVLFDGEHENSRATLDTDYKANRVDYGAVPEEDSPFSQLEDVYAALDYLGILHSETTVCEADDWIAGYAARCDEDSEVYIASFDSDFFQLIRDNIRVVRYRGSSSVICTPEYVREKFGVEPWQYADFKALVGDPSDNICGAERIGPKTAAALLGKFGRLEHVLSHAQEIRQPSVRASVLRNAERLKTNYELIRLTGEAELPFSIEELLYSYYGITTGAVLKGIGLQ